MGRSLKFDLGEWHDDYDEPGSKLARRLLVVQGHVRRFLDTARAGPIRVVSMCAGQGRDLLEVLATHRRRADVSARLVETDPGSVARARETVAVAGLEGVDVRQQDAGTTSAYAGAVPADLILVCGVFGNISVTDIHTTISCLRSLAAPQATVVWTRHPRRLDVYRDIQRWLGTEGFELFAEDLPEDNAFGVGVHHLVAEPQPFQPGRRLFQFVPPESG